MILRFAVPGNDLSRAGEVSGEVKKVLKRAAICIYEGEINMIIHAKGGTSTVERNSDNFEITSAPGEGTTVIMTIAI